MQKRPYIPDRELVTRARAGDSTAYAEIVHRYTDLVCAAARSVTRDTYLTEEIAQDTFLCALQSLPSLRDPERLGPWLYGIAKRKALHTVSRRRAYEDLPETLADVLTPEDIVLRREARRAVRDAVAALGDKNRVCVEMYYFGEMSLPEIARACSLPQTTVKSRLYEARQKLKGVLSYMREEKTAVTPETPSLESRIRALTRDYRILRRIYGRENDAALSVAREAEELLATSPESEEKHRAMLVFYSVAPDREKYRDYIATFSPATLRMDEYLKRQWDALGKGDESVRIADEAAADAELHGVEGYASMLFWRGREKVRLGDIAGAEEDFREAERISAPQKINHALARTAVRAIAMLREHAEDRIEDCLNVTAETFALHGDGMYFIAQPGFSMRSVLGHLHRYDSILYYISRCGDTFYDASMEVGASRVSEKDASTLTLISREETIAVPAGTFRDCLHVAMTDGDMYADAWYAQGVGLVRTVIGDAAGEERYDLSEYEIHGGAGFFPLAEGNRWKYENPALPPYLFSHFETVIDYTDGVIANACRYNLVAMRKNHAALFPPDGTLLIEQCDRLCHEWKTEEAIESLREAVRVNTSAYTTSVALGGIDYLTRFREAETQGFRFCPSSYNVGSLFRRNGQMLVSEGDISFGPYRYGTRHSENRIFGMKPFRWLTDLTGCLFDEKWEIGYTESRPVDVFGTTGHLTLRVEDGGTVTVPAGTFTDTLKITLDAVSDAVAEGKTGYFGNYYRHVYSGVKEYYFAPGVGIVLLLCEWGDSLSSRCELLDYRCPASDGSHMPIQIGNRWEYGEATLTAEGYRARRNTSIVGGMDCRYTYTDAQEFWYLGTEDAYNAAKADGTLK